MSDLDYSRDVACPLDRCRTLLVDEAFLTAFVELQEPIEPRIKVAPETWSSTLEWSVATEGIPAVFSRLLPKTVPVRLVINVPADSGSAGSISLDLEGKPSGRLRASLELAASGEEQDRTALGVQGSFKIDLGLLSGTVANYLKPELIVPILDELADLLEQWSSGPLA